MRCCFRSRSAGSAPTCRMRAKPLQRVDQSHLVINALLPTGIQNSHDAGPLNGELSPG